MYTDVIRNKYGYYELMKKPTENELRDYYANKYYQESKSTYSNEYSDEEKTYIRNKIQQKYEIIKDMLKESEKANPSILDIGFGEGWALSFFKELSWAVTGIDYSDFGSRTHNPEIVKDVILGDVNETISNLLISGNKYTVIWIDNVLEHVLHPLELLKNCRELLKENGVLVIEVPNDFSIVQHNLYKNEVVQNPFWVVNPDHISYYNREGLVSICNDSGLNCMDIISDFPIDFNLFNENTNYIHDKKVGKSVHEARIKVENLLHSISIEKTNQLYKALAELGLGRQITGFFIVGDKI